jgi:hypothetical protein
MALSVKKTAESNLRVLFSKHQFPPVDVAIAVLQKSGRGEQELASQLYDTYASLTKGIMQVMNFKTRDMKTLAKVMEITFSWEGQKFEPIELSDFKFSYAVPDCPMLHAGKNVSAGVKGKFCDLYCTSVSQAMTDTVLGKGKATCRWDKSLVISGKKCKLLWEKTETE